MAFGDDFDCSVDHLYGGLIVNRVRRHRHAGCPSFCVGHGVFRQGWVIEVREYREIDDAQGFVATGGRLPADKVLPDVRGPSPGSRRSVPRRPSRAATARGPPAPTAASSRTGTKCRRHSPAERRSPGPWGPIALHRCWAAR